MKNRDVLALMSWLASMLLGIAITIYTEMGVKVSKVVWFIFIALCVVNSWMLFSKIKK